MVSTQVMLLVDGEVDAYSINPPPDMRNMTEQFLVGCNWKTRHYRGFRGEIYDLQVNNGDNGMSIFYLLYAGFTPSG